MNHNFSLERMEGWGWGGGGLGLGKDVVVTKKIKQEIDKGHFNEPF